MTIQEAEQWAVRQCFMQEHFRVTCNEGTCNADKCRYHAACKRGVKKALRAIKQVRDNW